MVSPKCCPRGRRPGTHPGPENCTSSRRVTPDAAPRPHRGPAHAAPPGGLSTRRAWSEKQKGLFPFVRPFTFRRYSRHPTPVSPAMPERKRQILHQRSSTITLHELTPRKSTVCTHAGGPRACFWPRVHITSCAHQISERAMNPLPSKYEWPSISGSKAASAGRNFANASEPLCTFA